MQVHDCDDCFSAVLDDEEHAKREAMQDGPPAFVEHAWILLRASLNSFERGPKFSQELRAKATAFAVVPHCCFERIDLCLGPNAQPRHLAPGTETLLNPLDRFPPGPGFTRRPSMCGQPFLQQRPLPLLERHLVDGRRDAVPQ